MPRDAELGEWSRKQVIKVFFHRCAIDFFLSKKILKFIILWQIFMCWSKIFLYGHIDFFGVRNFNNKHKFELLVRVICIWGASYEVRVIPLSKKHPNLCMLAIFNFETNNRIFQHRNWHQLRTFSFLLDSFFLKVQIFFNNDQICYFWYFYQIHDCN